jgi:hypothetical protein
MISTFIDGPHNLKPEKKQRLDNWRVMLFQVVQLVARRKTRIPAHFHSSWIKHVSVICGQLGNYYEPRAQLQNHVPVRKKTVR